MQQNLSIALPQMAVKALSENWLFKELGHLHWKMLYKGLNVSSSAIKNANGDRLLATFTRVTIECNSHLQAFKENDQVNIQGTIQRFGQAMYFSDIGFQTDNATIQAALMTNFSVNNADNNKKLGNSKPVITTNDIAKLSKIPPLGHELRMLKAGRIQQLITKNAVFNILENPIIELEYIFNPYYDFNGAGLLYFAAYPIINDICEARYFNTKKPQERWELNYATTYKDVFYERNCNIDDTILYQLVEWEHLNENQIKTASILRRKSDGKKIARIFSVKTKINQQ